MWKNAPTQYTKYEQRSLQRWVSTLKFVDFIADVIRIFLIERS